MRHALIVPVLTIAAVIGSTQPSGAAPFCFVSTINLGIPDCSYHTWQQCRASIGGGGDYCELNRNGRYSFDVSNPGNPRVVYPEPYRKVRRR